MPPHNILSLLEKDHRDIHLLLSSLITDCENEKEIAPGRIAKLYEMVEQHTLMEETLIYPQAEQEERVSDIADHSYAEHEQYKAKLRNLQTISDPDTLARKCRELLDFMLRHHNTEEYALFSGLRELWDDDMLEALGRRMQASQSQHVSG